MPAPPEYLILLYIAVGVLAAVMVWITELWIAEWLQHRRDPL